ncbi:kti12, chromatin associated [Chytridiales sp. JEL 0842]|nr:kti12, chromatin associated [Chytridiales sp. JEL 0842]
MPLIVMCGLPCSGKTTRAKQLAQVIEKAIEEYNNEIETAPSQIHPQTGRELQKKIKMQPKVIIVNEESLNINRAEAYQDANEEKKARGALLSAVERYLTKDNVVILDSMNYIKGFRYQLFCVSKGISTTQCTVFCMVPPETTTEWNNARPPEEAYPPDIHASLLCRLEEPEPRNRWDHPLFPLLSTDPIPANFASDLLLARRPNPHFSVATKPLAETNYLHEMDIAMRKVADRVLEASRNGEVGEIVVGNDSSKSAKVTVVVPSKGVSVSEMGRLRRQYMSTLNKIEARLEIDQITTGFAEYLTKSWN